MKTENTMKTKIKLGDCVFTTPCSYNFSLRDLVSFLISKVSKGPTHVMLGAGRNKVIHLDWPSMRCESFDDAMKNRKGAKVVIVRPKYSFKQKMKLLFYITLIKKCKIKYSLAHLIKIGLAFLFPSLRYRNWVSGFGTCSNFAGGLLSSAGVTIPFQKFVTPSDLYSVVRFMQ